MVQCPICNTYLVGCPTCGEYFCPDCSRTEVDLQEEYEDDN